jgi:hypothetical protein
MACSLVQVGERPSNMPPHHAKHGCIIAQPTPKIYIQPLSHSFFPPVLRIYPILQSFSPLSELTSSPCFHSLQCAISPPSPLSATTWISTVTTRSIRTPFHRRPPLICSARSISPLRPAPMRSMKRHCSKHSPT